MSTHADPGHAAPPAGVRGASWLRRALFGDWHPLLRDPLDLLRLSFAIAAIAFFIAGSTEYGIG